jgi:ppGpp synthetase/RelA/SpoT-type nucleotidyltranferase
MNFKEWLLEQTKPAKIYVDLDGTLVADHRRLLPHALKFIDQLERLADVAILTHGNTELQQKLAKRLSIHLPVIGKDKYHTVKKDPSAILIDDRLPSDPRTKNKMKALGITAHRVLTVKGDIEKLLKKVETLLVSEWVETNPQPLPKKQKFKTYDKAKDMAEDREQKFLCGMEESAPGHKVVVDIKSKTSFKNKTVKREKAPEKVFDVLRGAILVDNKNQIDAVIANLKKNFLVKKVDHKDKPDLAKDPLGYYGAVHVDVVVNDMICEIQVMTKKLWKAKNEVHDMYQKYRGDKNPPEDVVEKLKMAYRKGNGD